MIHTSVCEPFDDLGDSGSFLSDGYVDAVQLGLFNLPVVKPLLVDDRVNGNSSFTVND